MAKIELDKYYTPPEISKYCIEKTFEILKGEEISEIIEPSAGDGSFSNQIENCIAYDIKPEGENIIEQDFLTLDLSYKKGRMFIGNPPFGLSSNLARKFLIKCAKLGDYISFILPRSFANKYNNYFNTEKYSFNLILTEDLQTMFKFVDKRLKFSLCIYKRVNNEELFRIPKYDLDGCKIKISDTRTKLDTSNYDFGICAWGDGIGNECFSIADYSFTYWFKVKKEYLNIVRELLLKPKYLLDIAREKCSSTPKISLFEVRKLIYENIPELRKKG
jgi:hypothetical protein